MTKLLIFCFSLCSSLVISAEKPKEYDARNLTFRDRLKLIQEIKAEKRTKVISPETQSETILSDLKSKGTSGIAEAKEKVNGLDRDFIAKEQGKAVEQNAFDKISDAMKMKDGKIKEYTQSGSEEMLNGNLYKSSYVIEYENGTTQSVQFIYVKPDLSGGYKLMEVKVN